MEEVKETKLDVLIQSFEKTYIGNSKQVFPQVYFQDMDRMYAESLVLGVTRYAIEKYLGWTPKQARWGLTMDILKKLNLVPYILPYINFPKEYENSDYKINYILYRLYPKEVQIDVKEQCLLMYDKILNGDIKHFPTSWVSSIEGIKRFTILLQHALNKRPRFKNKEDLYRFIFSPEATSFLHDARLYYYGVKLYGTVPEAYHLGLPEPKRSEFLYNYGLWRKAQKKPF